MIKVGISGGDTSCAGELIRLLVNHPDVEIIFVRAKGKGGVPLECVHHGLIGEISMNMTESADLSAIDLLFIADSDPICSVEEYPDGLRVIDMCGGHKDCPAFVTGVSEAFRKPLVRGARFSRLVHPLASVAMVALFPPALNLLLKDVSLSVQMSADLMEAALAEEAVAELSCLLRQVQLSFPGNVVLSGITEGHGRGMRLTAEFSSAMSAEDIAALYEAVYDDHNFTFLTSRHCHRADVEGTNRILINISKPMPDKVVVDTVADARMRGGAGEAMHVMNLLFGLHEKTGLALKASMYEKEY